MPTATNEPDELNEDVQQSQHEINLQFVFANNDERLLESYNVLIATGEKIALVHDEKLVEKLRSTFARYAAAQKLGKIRFMNVFHVEQTDKDFYLMQVEIDFGTKLSFKYGPKERYVEYQAWGYAQARENLGKAYVRELTSADKWVGLLMPIRIRFPESPRFTNRYYLNGDNVPKIREHFNPAFVDAMGHVDDLALIIHEQDVIVGIPKVISGKHMLSVLNMLSHAAFLGHAEEKLQAMEAPAAGMETEDSSGFEL